DDRLCDQLRRSAIRIKISQNSVRARLRESHVVIKGAVLKRGMVMHKKLQVLAHDECMKKPLMHFHEIRDRSVLPRVVHLEFEARGLSYSQRAWRHREIQVI